jgi:hypothetical protein
MRSFNCIFSSLIDVVVFIILITPQVFCFMIEGRILYFYCSLIVNYHHFFILSVFGSLYLCFLNARFSLLSLYLSFLTVELSLLSLYLCFLTVELSLLNLPTFPMLLYTFLLDLFFNL